MKKITKLAALTALIIGLTGCAKQQHPSDVTEATINYPDVTLVSWSDFHSAIYEKVGKDGVATGGLPVFMAAIEHARGDGLSLLIDGGDMCQGDTVFNEAKGMGMVEVMNALKIDAATFGNHEFDYGSSEKYPDSPRGALQEMIEASQFQWVNANIAPTAENTDHWPYPQLKPYTIIPKGPYRIAVIGITTHETTISTNITNVAGIEFHRAAETLKQIIPEVVAQDPDFVIIDAHISGLPTVEYNLGDTLQDVPFDDEIGEILALPDDIKKHINLLLSAHSHSSFIAHEGNLTIIQSPNKGSEFTTMTLFGDKDGLHLNRASIQKHHTTHIPIDVACGEPKVAFTPIDVGGVTLMPSQLGANIVTKYEKRMTHDRCEIVSCADEPIERSKTQESPLGNLVADSMLDLYPDSDIALVNSGGLRTDLPKGKIYRDTLSGVMPYDNYVQQLRVTGSDIIKMLKLSSSLKNGLTFVSNLTYQFEPDCKNPEDLNGDGNIDPWENNCLCEEILIKGQPIVPSQIYTIVTSSFLVDGGDDHAVCFKNAERLNTGTTIRENLIRYAQSKDGCFVKSSLISSDSPRIKITSCNGKYAIK